jgi:hypothetical protein
LRGIVLEQKFLRAEKKQISESLLHGGSAGSDRRDSSTAVRKDDSATQPIFSGLQLEKALLQEQRVDLEISSLGSVLEFFHNVVSCRGDRESDEVHGFPDGFRRVKLAVDQSNLALELIPVSDVRGDFGLLLLCGRHFLLRGVVL